MAELTTFDELNAIKGIKMTHLNFCSIVKKIDQLRILLFDSKINVLTFSETWLQPHLHSDLINIEGYQLYRLDRDPKGKANKRGGGLATFIKNAHSSSCEKLDNLDVSNGDMEARWILLHRAHWKNVIICNLYRPPSGKLNKAVSYLNECIASINMEKNDLFLLGRFPK